MASIDELKQAVLAEIDLPNLLIEMMKEGVVDPKNVLNTNALKDGKFDIFVDQRKTRNVQIICPFHETNTATACTLRISEKPHHLICYNPDCPTNGKSLDAIAVVMALQLGVEMDELFSGGYKWVQALKILGHKIGMELDEKDDSKTTESELKDREIIEIRNEAGELYNKALLEHAKKYQAMNYMLKTRGFENAPIPFQSLIKKYKLGFAPIEWKKDGDKNIPIKDWLYNQMKEKYNDQQLIDAGVCLQSKYGMIDFLSGVVIPYFSKGKINNLYSRVLTKNKERRHLRLLGGVDVPVNFDEAKKHEWVIFVEGEISWLSLIALGYENVISNRGAKGLKPAHIELLKGTKIKTIYLAYDPDTAGVSGAKKSGEDLSHQGFDVRIINLVEGDPNDFLIRGGKKEEFDEMIENALSYEAFLALDELKNANVKSPADRLSVLRKIKKHLDYLDDDEKLIVATEVSEKIQIDRDQLMLAWQKNPIVKPKMNLNHWWVWAFDDIELYQVFQTKYPNTVWVEDAEQFIELVKNSELVTHMFINESMNEESKNKIKTGISDTDMKLIEIQQTDRFKQQINLDSTELVNYFKRA